jgi:DNA-binding XRE family transcriptional regulator
MPTVREVRLELGMTQLAFAKSLGVARRSVINWENGHCLPDAARNRDIRCLMRRRGLTTRTHGSVPLRYDPMKMDKYLGSPADAGRHWSRMSRAERRSWWGHRVKYRKLKADIEAGRVIAQPIVAYLDAAPDQDCM